MEAVIKLQFLYSYFEKINIMLHDYFVERQI